MAINAVNVLLVSMFVISALVARTGGRSVAPKVGAVLLLNAV
jgi:hypothetical protein